MRKTAWYVLMFVFLCSGFMASGCSQQPKSQNSSEAINTAKAMKTVQEQADYLVQQAKGFYNSKQFQDAVATAQYVLQNVDKNSQEAKNLLEKAKADIEAAAKKAVEDVKGKLGSFGK